MPLQRSREARISAQLMIRKGRSERRKKKKMGHYQYSLIDIVIIVNQTLSYPNSTKAGELRTRTRAVFHPQFYSSLLDSRRLKRIARTIPSSFRPLQAIRRRCFQHGRYILSREHSLYTQDSLFRVASPYACA